MQAPPKQCTHCRDRLIRPRLPHDEVKAVNGELSICMPPPVNVSVTLTFEPITFIGSTIENTCASFGSNISKQSLKTLLFTALEVYLYTTMRYIDWDFTYLLTYLYLDGLSLLDTTVTAKFVNRKIEIDYRTCRGWWCTMTVLLHTFVIYCAKQHCIKTQ